MGRELEWVIIVRFGFIILHYNNIELTRKAIESVRLLDRADYSSTESSENGRNQHFVDIVVVDNGSPNGTGEVLKCEYENVDDVHVILTGENTGFSAGNNVGFRYIKGLPGEEFDFVIALNNDITFPQKDFLSRLVAVYKSSNPQFYVAGPDVYTPHIRSHISPLAAKVRGKCEAEDAISVLEKINEDFKSGVTFANYTRFLQEKYQGTGMLKLYNSLRKGEYDGALPHDTEAYDCVLNGACLIFDRRFVLENDFLFEEKTFLYVEEDFLTRRMVTAKKTTRYCPELIVDHVGQGSSGFGKMSYRDYVKKNISTNERCIESWKIYIESLGED